MATAKQIHKKVVAFQTLQGLALLADQQGIAAMIELEWYVGMLEKHIDLLERRIIKGGKIPQQENIFSIFLPFTEWVNKGKKNPSVEIGKKLFVTTDQFNLIVDYRLGVHQTDQDVLPEIVDNLYQKYAALIALLSTDNGFSTKEIKQLIETVYPTIKLAMPKKGKRKTRRKKQII